MPADTIPPAYPAPSPQGKRPDMCMCWRLCSSLTIRTGEEVRVSTAISVASLVRKPRLRCPKTVNACCSLRVTNCGIQKCSGEEMSPGAYEDVGKSYESRPLTKSAIRCAGAVCRLLPCMKQSCSSLCWKRIISSGSSRSASIYVSTSSGCNAVDHNLSVVRCSRDDEATRTHAE